MHPTFRETLMQPSSLTSANYCQMPVFRVWAQSSFLYSAQCPVLSKRGTKDSPFKLDFGIQQKTLRSRILSQLSQVCVLYIF